MRAVWTFVLFLLASVALISAIPRADLPETSFNEVDAPVNQAPPAVSGGRFVRPDVAPAILPNHVCETGRGARCQSVDRKSATPLVRRDQHSLQDLLCTFLI
jgi:hypothetical protein